MDTADAVRALAALAQEHRLDIFRCLVRKGPSGLAAGEIARTLHMPPARLSFHVKELARAGLVRSWREGRSIRYAIHVEAMRRLMGFLTQECCGGWPELCAPALTAAFRRCAPPSEEPKESETAP